MINEDSTGAIFAADRPVHTSRTKHMEVRYHFVRERVESGELKIMYVPTDKQIADVLTKPLGTLQFNKLTGDMMGRRDED